MNRLQNFEWYFFADDGFGNMIHIMDAVASKYYILFSDWYPETHKHPWDC